jgi:hypothetical protein
MKKIYILLSSIALLVLLAASFLLLDFHIAHSQNRINSSISTYATSLQKGEKLRPNQPLVVYVAGSGALASAFRQELVQRLQASPEFGNVKLHGSPIETMDQPVLRVEIVREAVTWTPLYGKASPTFQIAFASDGDVTWRNKGTVFMPNDMGPVVRLQGTFEQVDSTYGLLSQPAYMRLLSESAAEQIVKSLSNALERPAG